MKIGLYAIVPEEIFKFFTERGCFQPPPMSNRVNTDNKSVCMFFLDVV